MAPVDLAPLRQDDALEALGDRLDDLDRVDEQSEVALDIVGFDAAVEPAVEDVRHVAQAGQPLPGGGSVEEVSGDIAGARLEVGAPAGDGYDLPRGIAAELLDQAPADHAETADHERLP